MPRQARDARLDLSGRKAALGEENAEPRKPKIAVPRLPWEDFSTDNERVRRKNPNGSSRARKSSPFAAEYDPNLCISTRRPRARACSAVWSLGLAKLCRLMRMLTDGHARRASFLGAPGGSRRRGAVLAP